MGLINMMDIHKGEIPSSPVNVADLGDMDVPTLVEEDVEMGIYVDKMD